MSRRILSWSTAILTLAIVCAAAGTNSDARLAASAQVPPNQRPRAVGVLKLEMATLYVSVYDRDGKFVNGLAQDAFRVYEDKVEQKIAVFSHEDVPTSFGLLIDPSFSKLEFGKNAAHRFFQGSNPRDEFFVADFDDHVEMVKTLEDLDDVLGRTPAHHGLALLDSIYSELRTIGSTRNAKKALLIISEGYDNKSSHSRDELRDLVKRSGISLYALIWNPLPVVGSTEQVNGSDFLVELCKLTGGRAITFRDARDPLSIVSDIRAEIHNQYALGYYPTNAMNGPHDMRWRKIEVKVKAKDVRGPLKVYAPPGYIYSTTSR